MTRFRASWLGALTGASAGVLATACALAIGDLPEGVDEVPSSGGSGGVAGQGGSSGEAGSAGSAGAAGSGGEAGSSGGAAGSGGCCDCDGDTYAAKGPPCNGDDCDDADNRAHPGQTTPYDTPSPSNGYDFDCNGQTIPEHTKKLDCGLGVALCPPPTTQGYLATPPACGQSGDWGYCTNDGIACKPTVAESRKQKCL